MPIVAKTANETRSTLLYRRIPGSFRESIADRAHEGGIRYSSLPAFCPARLPARRPSVTTQRTMGGPGVRRCVSGARGCVRTARLGVSERRVRLGNYALFWVVRPSGRRDKPPHAAAGRRTGGGSGWFTVSRHLP